jgi:hypothetical protein
MDATHFGIDWEDEDDFEKIDNVLDVVHSALELPTEDEDQFSPEKKMSSPRMRRDTVMVSGGVPGHRGGLGSAKQVAPERKVAKRQQESEVWPETGGFRDLLQRAIRDRRAVLSNLKQPLLVLPNSTFRMAWDIGMVTVLFYVAIFTPFQMAFLAYEHDIATPQKWPVFFALDRVVDAVFLTDMFINFRSAWYEQDSSVMFFDQKEAIRRYLKGWFALDLLALFPWEVLPLLFDFNGGSGLRLPKLVKLVRLMKILKVVGANRVLRRAEQNMGIKYGVVRLVKFTAMLVAIAHWLACLFMFITTFDSEGGDDSDSCEAYQDGAIDGKWRWALYCGCECSTAETYVAALYWSIMTLTTIGYGDVSPQNAGEMVFVTVSMLVGAGVFSFVVGTCCSLVEGLDKAGLQFQEEFDAVNDYMNVCEVDTNMRRRVRAYIWKYRDLSTRRNETEILNLMSPSLQQGFILHNYAHMIRGILSLKGAPDQFVVEMAGTATRKLYGPRDTISYQWAVGDPFYLLKKGEVISCRSPKPGAPIEFVTRFRNSGFWNERLLAFNSYVDCSIKAMTFTEVVAFDAGEIRDVLRRFPNGHARVKQSVLRRLWKFSASKASVRHAIDTILTQQALEAHDRTAKEANKGTSNHVKLSSVGFQRTTSSKSASTSIQVMEDEEDEHELGSLDTGEPGWVQRHQGKHTKGAASSLLGMPSGSQDSIEVEDADEGVAMTRKSVQFMPQKAALPPVNSN